MLAEFELILEDFEQELAAIEGMIAALPTTGQGTTSGRSRVAGANAATLLLAAVFEEFVRQQVRAVFAAKVAAATCASDLPPKIRKAVWKRSLERLARTPLDDLAQNASALEARLGATLAFCVNGDITADVGQDVAHNENNMRGAELNRLFNQVGVTNMCSGAAKRDELQIFLGRDAPGKANTDIEVRLEEFFRRRNEVAHAITLNSSSGPTSLEADINFFRELARAIACHCVASCIKQDAMADHPVFTMESTALAD